MKKAEMELQNASYAGRMAQALADERNGSLANAISTALACLDYVAGMMQYQRKFGNSDARSVTAIDLIFRVAPLLLDSASLDAVEALLKSRRLVERNTETNLGDGLALARARLQDHYRLWCLIESEQTVRQDELRQRLGGQQNYWRTLAGQWAAACLLVRVPAGSNYELRFATVMTETVTGKCTVCGQTTSAEKVLFLDQMECKHCQNRCHFVILASVTDH